MELIFEFYLLPFYVDKIIREELNVHIMVVLVVSDAKRAKKDFFNDPILTRWHGQR
jgi:hypothetical protein